MGQENINRVAGNCHSSISAANLRSQSDLFPLRLCPLAVLSPILVPFGKDFSPQRTQRFAQRNAEWGLLCGLCELLRVLCVESEGSGVRLRLRRAALCVNNFPHDSE